MWCQLFICQAVLMRFHLTVTKIMQLRAKTEKKMNPLTMFCTLLICLPFCWQVLYLQAPHTLYLKKKLQNESFGAPFNKMFFSSNLRAN